MKFLTTATAVLLLAGCTAETADNKPFDVMETTIADIHAAYQSGKLTARQLTQMYLDRIAAYDKKGPTINSVITVNPKALEEADRLDSAFRASGPVGPLHGIPVLLKDQMDAAGMPTTLGSVLFKDYMPQRDAFVVEKLKKAGAIILAKMTLGELGRGDSYGSLYGQTHNPYDLLRTVGGSAGGPGAGTAANFGALAVGQEGLASIRRPAAWNSIVGMRPTSGLVSRSGVWEGWPAKNGSLGPMTRTVTDLAKLLDVMVGFDPEDPQTALGVGQAPDTYTRFLDANGLKGARIGVLRETIGLMSDPEAEDFKELNSHFDQSVAELKAAGAEVVDPVVIPRLQELLARRAASPIEAIEAAKLFFSRNPNPPYKTREDMEKSPDYVKVVQIRRASGPAPPAPPVEPALARYNEYLNAREELMINVMKVMADNKLDAIVHKSVDHSPNLIKDGINPPYINQKGAPTWNTFLIYVSSISVPSGFTKNGLPVGITFFGRPYSEPMMIKLAYAYEQATHHRKPPMTTPPLHTAER